MINSIIYCFIICFIISNFIQILIRRYLKLINNSLVICDYLLIDIITSIICTIFFFLYGHNFSSLLYIVMIFIFLMIFIIDGITFIIPDLCFAGLLILGTVKSIINIDIENILILMIFMLIVILLNMICNHLKEIEFIGYGDIKLFFAFGLIASTKCLFVGIIIASYLALIWEIIVKKKARKMFPFGPYLALGFLLSILINDFIL